MMENEIQKSFQLPKHGDLYRRKDGSWYVASSGGEAPAIKEGDLSRSIKSETPRAFGGLSILSVSANTPYAEAAEKGLGKFAIKGPRPFIWPAYLKTLKRFPKLLLGLPSGPSGNAVP